MKYEREEDQDPGRRKCRKLKKEELAGLGASAALSGVSERSREWVKKEESSGATGVGQRPE